MNLKKFYEEQKHSIYEIQQELKLSHYSLYKYYGSTQKIKNMPTELLRKIAEFEEIEPNELYEKMLEYAEKINL